MIGNVEDMLDRVHVRVESFHDGFLWRDVKEFVDRSFHDMTDSFFVDSAILLEPHVILKPLSGSVANSINAKKHEDFERNVQILFLLICHSHIAPRPNQVVFLIDIISQSKLNQVD